MSFSSDELRQAAPLTPCEASRGRQPPL